MFKNKISKEEEIKNVLLEMGVLLADYGHVWTKRLKAAFNKALAHLGTEAK